ncbi:colony stimulating factor 3 (granulocyte) a [Amia ocellicauda]|uniref:colony stimulating factor 3 (granulocyte) a n=1 Tax=Amia ocellicauda TaxID=2972642 RepID=UPI003463D477
MAQLVHLAALPEYSGEVGNLKEDPQFLKVLKSSQKLVKKILNDIPQVHESLALPNYQSNDLLLMVATLEIPMVPILTSLSADFTLEMSLIRILEGLQIFKDLLSIIRHHTTPPEKLDILLADINDLLSQIYKMFELVQLDSSVRYTGSGLASRLVGDFQKRVAAHIILTNMQDFAESMHRSLRFMRS